LSDSIRAAQHALSPTPRPYAALKKFLKKHAVDEELAVIDKKLGGIVQEKLGIPCLYRWASALLGHVQC
jgi:hypothetical protein